MASVRTLGLIPAGGVCPEFSLSSNYDLKDLSLLEAMTFMWRIKEIDFFISANIRTNLTQFTLDEEGDITIISRFSINHPVSQGGTMKSAYSDFQESFLACNKGGFLFEWKDEERYRSASIYSLNAGTASPRVTAGNAIINPTTQGWDIPFFLYFNFPSNDALLPIPDGVPEPRPAIAIRPKAEDVFPSIGENYNLTFDVNHVVNPNALIASEVTQEKEHTLELSYVFNDPQDALPIDESGETLYGYDSPAISADIFELTLTPRYWGYDPLDGKGPIYNAENGSQLRPYSDWT